MFQKAHQTLHRLRRCVQEYNYEFQPKSKQDAHTRRIQVCYKHYYDRREWDIIVFKTNGNVFVEHSLLRSINANTAEEMSKQTHTMLQPPSAELFWIVSSQAMSFKIYEHDIRLHVSIACATCSPKSTGTNRQHLSDSTPSPSLVDRKVYNKIILKEESSQKENWSEMWWKLTIIVVMHLVEFF